MSYIQTSGGLYLDRRASTPSLEVATQTFGKTSEDRFNRIKTQQERHQAYADMRDNSPLIGGFLLALQTLLRQAEWTFVPGEGPDAARALDIAERGREAMRTPWPEFVEDLGSCVVYGWVAPEMTLRVEPDGAVIWADIAPRSQDEWTQWLYDQAGEFAGWTQNTMRTYGGGGFRSIPLWKSVYMEGKLAPGRAPGGRSWLQNSDKSNYYVNRLEEAEALRVDNDATGLPVYEVPPALLNPNADAAMKADKRAKELFVQKIHRGKFEGILIPAEETNAGKTGYKLRSMASPGSPTTADTPIKRHEVNSMVPVLAQFLSLGRESGSFALADNFSDLFGLSASSFVLREADAINRRAIPLPMILSGILDRRAWPRAVGGDIESRNIGQFTDALSKLIPLEVIQRSPALSEYTHRVMKIPAYNPALPAPTPTP